MAVSDYLTAAILGRAVGVRGWLRWHARVEDLSLVTQQATWLLRYQQDLIHVEVATLRQTRHHNLVLFKGCTDKDQASMWTHAEVLISRKALPEPETGRYYWHDLHGFSVWNTQRQHLGRLQSFLETGANDVMVVERDKQHLIPWIDHVIVSVDTEQKKIIVDWQADDL